MTFLALPTWMKASMARCTCSVECAAESCTRMRASPCSATINQRERERKEREKDLWDYGVAEADHVDALLQHLISKFRSKT